MSRPTELEILLGSIRCYALENETSLDTWQRIIGEHITLKDNLRDQFAMHTLPDNAMLIDWSKRHDLLEMTKIAVKNAYIVADLMMEARKK